MDEQISLRLFGRHNVVAVCALELAEGQEHYVARRPSRSARAAYEPDGWPRAIYLTRPSVGVVFVAREGPTAPLLVRLMIAASHQRRGIGRQVVRMVAEDLARAGATGMLTSYVPGPQEPAGFYRACGFVETARARRRAGHEPGARATGRLSGAPPGWRLSLPRFFIPAASTSRISSGSASAPRQGPPPLPSRRHAEPPRLPHARAGLVSLPPPGGTVSTLPAEMWGLDTRGPEFVRLRRRLREKKTAVTPGRRADAAAHGAAGCLP